MTILGIDPGKTGALALLDGDSFELVNVYDQPIIATGKRGDFDIAAMVTLVEHLRPDKIALERVRPMPSQGIGAKMGSVSAFTFGGGFYAWRTIAACLRIPLILVTPQQWKKVMMNGCPRGETDAQRKEASRQRALQLWPDKADRFKRKKDHARAEAALIAASVVWGCIGTDA